MYLRVPIYILHFLILSGTCPLNVITLGFSGGIFIPNCSAVLREVDVVC